MPIIFVLIPILFYVFIVVVLVYFIYKRIIEYDKEDFEKRDN